MENHHSLTRSMMRLPRKSRSFSVSLQKSEEIEAVEADQYPLDEIFGTEIRTRVIFKRHSQDFGRKPSLHCHSSSPRSSSIIYTSTTNLSKRIMKVISRKRDNGESQSCTYRGAALLDDNSPRPFG